MENHSVNCTCTHCVHEWLSEPVNQKTTEILLETKHNDKDNNGPKK